MHHRLRRVGRVALDVNQVDRFLAVREAGETTSQSEMGGFDAAFEQLGPTVSPSLVDSVSKVRTCPLDMVNGDQPPMYQQWRSPVLLATADSLQLVAHRILRRT